MNISIQLDSRIDLSTLHGGFVLYSYYPSDYVLVRSRVTIKVL
jgi:hypothetical protein